MKGSARGVKPAIAIKSSPEWRRGASACSRKSLVDIAHHVLQIAPGQIKFDHLAVRGIMGDGAAEANYMQYALSWEQ